MVVESYTMKEITVFKVNSRQHRFILFETNPSSNRDTDLIKFVTTPANNKLESLQSPYPRGEGVLNEC